MTSIRVDAEAIAALGETLADLGTQLAAAESGRADRWALGPGASAEAFDDLLTHWRRQRLVLSEALAELGEGARGAGAVYVDAERLIGGRFLLGGQW